MSKNKPVSIDVYYPQILCHNCGLFKKIEINYGVLIKDTQCPNCRCKTIYLFKDNSIRP